jgi:hypothetical protein
MSADGQISEHRERVGCSQVRAWRGRRGTTEVSVLTSCVVLLIAMSCVLLLACVLLSRGSRTTLRAQVDRKKAKSKSAKLSKIF